MDNATPPSASALEQTRSQALRELRNLLSEILSTAVAGEDVPEAFKNAGNWDRLIAQTETRLSNAWRQRFEKRREGQLPHRELELLPDEEHDQQVLSERFVDEVLNENRAPLDELEQQLAAMSGIAADETRPNPLGPNAWADGLRSGIREIECSPDDRDWLMEQIMPLLADRVGQFYTALSKQASSHGYAPARRGSAQAAAMAASQGKSGAPASAGGFAPELVEARQGPAQPMLMEDGGDEAASLDRLLGLLSAQRAPAGGVVVGDGGDGQFSGDGSAAAAEPVHPWTQADMMSVLSRLQNSYANAPGAAAGAASVGNLQAAIGNAAAQMGLAGGARAMPGQAQDTLALVSMLFEVLLDGKRLDERARSQLARLIVPYVRVAVLDRHLFMQSMHPGRRVLNLLVEALETAGSDLPQFKRLRELAFATIESIVSDFSDDLAIFEPLETALSAEIDSSRKRAELSEKRAAETHSARERREQARDSVAAFLSEALFGKRMPNALLEFLVGPWQHHQNVTVLREGEGSDEAIANQVLLRELLAASERGAIDAPEKLAPRLAEVLASSGHTDQAGQLAQELLAAFRPAAKPAPAAPGASVPLPAPPPKQVVVEREVLVASASAIVPVQESKDTFLAPERIDESLPVDLVTKYDGMPLGTWIDLVAEDGRVTSAKISFVSPISGKRILSNRRGQRVLCASVQELATMETEGRIRPRHSDTAFDQALHTVTRRLESANAPPP